jgi:hypothetical protein
MQRSLINKGLIWLSSSILGISLLTFYGDDLSVLFGLDQQGRALMLFWGFFVVGTTGCTSIIAIVNGLLKASMTVHRVPILPALIIFILSVVLFCYLLMSSFREASPIHLRPGETITI